MQTRTVSVPTSYHVRVSAPTWPVETLLLGAFLIVNAAYAAGQAERHQR